MTSVFQIARTLTLATFAAAILTMLAAGPATAALTALYQFNDDLQDASGSNANADYGTWSVGSFTGGGSPAYEGTDIPYVGADKAISLQAEYDAINLGSGSAFNPAVAMSVSMWVQQVLRNGNGELDINKNHWGVSRAGVYDWWNNKAGSTYPIKIQQDGSTHTRFSSNNVAFDQWKHIAFTVDTSDVNHNEVKVYENGVLTSGSHDGGNQAISSIAQAAVNTYIGSRHDGSYANFHGFVDDVAFFDHRLTPSEISTIMTGDYTAYGIPEPSSLALLASGLVWGVATMRRRRRR